MFIVQIGSSVYGTGFRTEDEALAHIVSRNTYLNSPEHRLEPTNFGKIHRYLNPRTGRWNNGVHFVHEVQAP